MTDDSTLTSEPLANSQHGVPLAYAVLGAYFQLEELLPEDAARIEQFNDQVLKWFGAELRWSMPSATALIEPFRETDLEYASTYPEGLALPELPEDEDPDTRELILLAELDKLRDYGVACHSGERPSHAGPYSYRFYADVTRIDLRQASYPARAILRITVPITTDFTEFYERVCELADVLRLRWGNAGYTYSAWEVQQYQQARSVIYAHARRHWGFDVNEYVSFLDVWHERIRTVNWVTFIGPELYGRLGELELDSRCLSLRQLATSKLIQAGPHPVCGDYNHLEIPEAYVSADATLRAIRQARGVNLLHPWTEDTTEQWLRRFEQQHI